VIPSFAITVAVTRYRNDKHLVIDESESRRHRKGSSVKAVEGIAFKIVREFSRLAYAGHYDELMGFYAEIDDSSLKGIENAEIPASRTPCGGLSFIVFQ
jgi:hypothetical protein